MCDTIAIVQKNRVLFAKNSDRDANEGQNIEWYPAIEHGPDKRLRCTYIEIPQVERTQAVMLSRPFWMWGAEMGSNEHGVTIGNEAVFTKEPYEKMPGLIGMDLLRLGLERAETAKAACEVITGLLEQYGQGGGCGHESKRFVYHNSFMVADPKEAYVIETAGRRWAVERVEGARTISNGLTIEGFADRYSNTIKTNLSGCKLRQYRTQTLANRVETVTDSMRLLQDHGEGQEHPEYHWTHGGLHAPCVHGGGVLANSQTTASWVAELRVDNCRHWVTATSAPCMSLFKPVSVSNPVDVGPRAEDRFDESLWWMHERLHRAVLKNPAELRPLFIAERDEVQTKWSQVPPSAAEAFAEHRALLGAWTPRVLDAAEECTDVRPPWARRYWAKRTAWAHAPATQAFT